MQLVLKAEEVPECQLTGDGTLGARLGWNTWLLTRPATADAEDVVINGEVAFRRRFGLTTAGEASEEITSCAPAPA